MEKNVAMDVFAALSQETRLDTFRLLTMQEPVGLAAGNIASQLGVPQNTLSTHLANLERSGSVVSERQGRSIIYRANIGRVRELADFLLQDCCGGHPELCEPMAADPQQCCAEEPTSHTPDVSRMESKA
jgi:ArsR family transcriptional regulator